MLVILKVSLCCWSYLTCTYSISSFCHCRFNRVNIPMPTVRCSHARRLSKRRRPAALTIHDTVYLKKYGQWTTILFAGAVFMNSHWMKFACFFLGYRYLKNPQIYDGAIGKNSSANNINCTSSNLSLRIIATTYFHSKSNIWGDVGARKVYTIAK